MSNFKKEPMITTPLELTHFGGLAKVLIPRQIDNGALTVTGFRCRLITACSTLSLKIYTRERLYDAIDKVSYLGIEEKNIPILHPDEDDGFHLNDVKWTTVIWNFAIYRSFEIWKKLSPHKLEKSLGSYLSSYARSSLKGKLGSANGEYLERYGSEHWVFKKFKQTSTDKAFKPFTRKAVEKCQQRARTMNHHH